MSKFQIFTDSSSDLSTEQRNKHHLEYFRMGINVNDAIYHADLDFKEYSPEQLYEWVKDTSKKVKTSLIEMREFVEKMKPLLDQGIDILYLACATVLSGSLNVFRLTMDELQKEYPDRKIIGIDTCRAGMALGLLAMDACDLQDQGESMDEIIDWVEKEKLTYNLCGTVETLTYLKNAGRVSGSSAFFGNLFGVKPIIIADTLGHNYAVAKVKGTKKSLTTLFDIVKDAVEGIERPTIYIGQGMAQEAADYFKKRFTEELNAEIVEYWVGPIIGISCGPGVIHLACKGKKVTITSPEK